MSDTDPASGPAGAQTITSSSAAPIPAPTSSTATPTTSTNTLTATSSSPVSVTVPLAIAVPTVTDAINTWFAEYFANSPISRSVECWNQAYAAKEQLIALLTANPGV